VLRQCAARRYALVSFAALRAALILRAPLLIRLRFAADPFGIIRFASLVSSATRRAAPHETPVPLRLRPYRQTA
jgi:hypothetical protein